MSSFLREKLVDELILYFSPRILGSSAISFSGIQDIEKLSKKIKFSISDMITINQDLKLTLESKYV
jgi:diaminohydroxyphosphoribosylaminopyrimidine deaminase/5-amino-6-(5-phosphoribosylamino)uracil reductase